MFKGIRLKLTMINIAVVGIIFILFSSGIYVLMKQNTARQSMQLMYSVAGEVRFRPAFRFPLINRHWADCFYVKTDENGDTSEVSSNSPLNPEEIPELLDAASANPDEAGIVKISIDTYRYLKSVSPSSHEQTFVFLSMRAEYETLARLRMILIITGLAGLCVVFVCSLFLADRALIPIRKSWERQKTFVADASHELRSPLAVIETNLELVLDNGSETVESQIKWLENIQTENRRMSRLVSDLLLLARADSDQQVFEKRHFKLNEALSEAAASMKPLADKKSMTLETDINIGSEYFGDEERIKQLAVILIDNAIKYTQPGGYVQVGLHHQQDGHFEIIVADNGEGMEKEHLDKIFERFYRVDKARSRESGGTGLGLAIADWIVKGHRGTITVSSTPGIGSVFKVVLPNTMIRGKQG